MSPAKNIIKSNLTDSILFIRTRSAVLNQLATEQMKKTLDIMKNLVSFASQYLFHKKDVLMLFVLNPFFFSTKIYRVTEFQCNKNESQKKKG